jgi:hypothetical protein
LKTTLLASVSKTLNEAKLADDFDLLNNFLSGGSAFAPLEQRSEFEMTTKDVGGWTVLKRYRPLTPSFASRRRGCRTQTRAETRISILETIQ